MRDFDLFLFEMLVLSGIVFWLLVFVYFMGGMHCG